MAQRKKASAKRPFTIDPIVVDLVPDPGEVPELRVLAGLCGVSDRGGHHRVYLAPDLSEYVEFRTSDFVRQQPASDSPLGGSFVWIKASAQLKRTFVGARGAQREYLKAYGDYTYFCPPWVTCPSRYETPTPRCYQPETPWCPATPRCHEITPTPRCHEITPTPRCPTPLD